MQDHSKPKQKLEFSLPLRKEKLAGGQRVAGGAEQIMYFEQEHA